jgi:hypothetical protein
MLRTPLDVFAYPRGYAYPRLNTTDPEVWQSTIIQNHKLNSNFCLNFKIKLWRLGPSISLGIKVVIKLRFRHDP